MNLTDFLRIKGLDLSKKIKVIRHKDGRGVDVHQLYKSGQLWLYQSYQEQDVFNCNYIVSFLGVENNKAIFVGVFEIKSVKKVQGLPDYYDVPYRGIAKTKSRFCYELLEIPGFYDLKDRMVIEWSGGARAWHQWLDTGDKEVVQLFPQGYVKEFSGYFDFVIDHSDLITLIENPDANQVWHRMLSAVAGVYLIVDKTNGMQYVGSASGTEGILGRWKNYAKTGHGGNITLMALLKDDPSYARNFQYTILHTLVKTLTQNEVLEYEKKYKKKLGTKAFGLNLN